MFTDFLILSFSSIIVGVIFGLGASLLLKYLHSTLENLDEHLSSSKECTIMFAIAYLSYLIAESFHLSGIITLFCCGFTLAHYGYHNVTSECQTGSILAVETLASVSEGFLFVYLGMSALTIKAANVNFFLIVFTLLATVFARFIGVLLPISLQNLFVTAPLKLNEQLLIASGGSVRGAIAFGLALQIQDIFLPNEQTLKTTVQIVVLISTIVMGSGMGQIASKLEIERTNEF